MCTRIAGNGGALLLSGAQTAEAIKNIHANYVETGKVFTLKNVENAISLGFSVAGMGLAGSSLAKSGKALKNLWQGEAITETAAISNATKKVSAVSSKQTSDSASRTSFVNAGMQLYSCESGINSIIKNGKVSIDDLKANPSIFSGKSVDEIAQVLTDAGYDVTVKASTRSKSGAQIIKINNPSGRKNISQVQVSPGGGRHGSSPYVKISTTDQGIIKIIDGSESFYKTDGKETATIIFSGGN